MENGVVSAQQVKGVQGDGYQSDGTIIRPFDGSLAGREIQLTFLSSLETPILLIWLKQA